MTTGYWVSQKTDLALSGGKGGLAFKRTYFSGNHQIESELGCCGRDILNFLPGTISKTRAKFL